MLADPPVPVFGICLGHQGIATAFGGNIKQSSTILHGQISRIRHDGSDSESLYHGVPDDFTAIRYNSLVVDDHDLSKDLVVDAWCYDGNKRVIMGLRHKRRPVWGVQYHPEVGAPLVNFTKLIPSLYALNMERKSWATFCTMRDVIMIHSIEISYILLAFHNIAFLPSQISS